jgi:mycothiol synthase
LDNLRNTADQIVLRRPNLGDLPPVRLTPGYTLRGFRPGDESAWAAIFAAAFPEMPDPRGIPEKVFLKDPLWLPERVFFACLDDVPVGCAAAWEDAALFGRRTGQVHWVAVLPGHLRKGLARAAVVAALAWMRDRGYADAALVTQVYRLPVIRLYLDLGFSPDLACFPEMPQRWAQVEAMLR